MSAVPILGVLAFAGAVVAWVTWHRTADERQSVQHHQHALETLRHVADRAEPPTTRRGAPRAAPAREAATRAAPPAHAPIRPRQPRPVRGRPVVLTPGSRPGGAKVPKTRAPSAAHPTMVFADDAAPASEPPTPATRPPPAPTDIGARGPHAHRHGLLWVRRHRQATLAAAAAVLVAAAILGVALSAGSTPPRPRPPAAHAHVSTDQRRDAAVPDQPAAQGRTGAAPAPTPSTTAALAPTLAGAHNATYAAPAAPYTVGIGASGSCWVMAQAVASGQVLWTGTLNAGDRRSLSASGTVVLRLGAASDVAVTVNGTPVELPAGFQSPFDLTFQA